ncbi:MAG TPA: sialidase family protein [Vicinamibacterales bacterium]|nr:sialidase family protein [Vicinamibacterales bacterium]
MPRALPSLAMFVLTMTALVPAQHPPLIRVVPVSAADARRPAEASVAINPTNPDHVIATFIQSSPPGQQPRSSSWQYVSTDGGLTWAGSPAENPERRVQGDDVIVFGRDGTAFHTYIAFDGIRVDRPEVAATGVWIRRTKDGLTWDPPVRIVDHVNTVMPFEDKPWTAVDRGAGSPHRGNVYVAWTRFDVYGSADPSHRSTIWFARSRDGGRSFQPPFRISDDTGDAKDGDGTLEGAVPAVGPNGEVYVVWAGPKGLSFDRSDDGGWTFGKDLLIGALAGGWDIPVPGIERHNGMPATAVDVSTGPNRGTLYVNFIDERNGDTDVFLLASRDGGRTWAERVRVNDDPKGAAQMFSWMAVDPADGAINMVFHDRRGQPGTITGLTLARSVDGGKTFVNHAVPVEPFDCCAASSFVGDYNGLDANGGRVVAVFPILTGGQQRMMAAVMRFRTGTQSLM